jgi:hypothetical protein
MLRLHSRSGQLAARLCIPALFLLVACIAPAALVACDVIPASGGLRAFPTATALGKNVVADDVGAGNGRNGAPAGTGRISGKSTIPPLLTATPTPTASATPGTPLPTSTATVTLTPFATPTHYRTATRIPAPPTVTPGAPGTSPTEQPGHGEPANTPLPLLSPGPGPSSSIFVDVGEPANRDGIVFMVTRVDRTTKRMDVIYRLTNQTGSAVIFSLTNADQRLVEGGTSKAPADPGGSTSVTLQNGQAYDSGTTFNIDTTNPDEDEVTFAIDNLPRIGSVRVRIPLREAH